MKTIKEEVYKGYSIKVKGKFIESTSVFKSVEAVYDSVQLEMVVEGDFGTPIFRKISPLKKIERIELKCTKVLMRKLMSCFLKRKNLSIKK